MSGPRFGHSPETLAFWRRLVRRALKQGALTPFFVFSSAPMVAALEELRSLGRGLPVPLRHWLSFKTQPLPALLDWWRTLGRPVEVVSEFELRAALTSGFAPERILVNGPAKDRWLPDVAVPGLRVHFDSRRELEALLPLARRQAWRVGIRCLTDEEHDPEHPAHPTQFGLARDEAVEALRRLAAAGVRFESVHFHLRTNVASADCYARALGQLAGICRAAKVQPRYLDCGGGFPPPHVLDRDGAPVARGFRLGAMRDVLRRAVGQFPGLQEVWLENGRFLSARTGVLALRVIEVKERRGVRQVIGDGGRTLHALVSTWEQHALHPLDPRPGRRVPTAVCGPTCMAFDQLGRRSLPERLGVGDVLVWFEAGAYHLPWETRFSHGPAAIFWHHGGRLAPVRGAASFRDWWPVGDRGQSCD